MKHKHPYGLGHFKMLLCAALCLSAGTAGNAAVNLNSTAASKTDDPRLAWWQDARFGMFIHWGVYAVPGNTWHGQSQAHSGENAEWLYQRVPIPVGDYKAFAKDFTAAQYDPKAWADVARDAGMRYVVLTAKHHEGFALWPTKAPGWNVMDSAAARDLVAPLAEAVRADGLKFGLYYSQSQDWTNPGGGKRNPNRATEPKKRDLADGEGWDDAHKGSYDTYLQTVALPQVKEILAAYHPDLIWWDTPIQMTPERAKPFLDTFAAYPEVITNNRLEDKFAYGDFMTPEQYVPPEGLPGRNFEVCMTMNDSWGFSKLNHNWKSTLTLLQILSDTASKGGNLLLNVGPTPDGKIPEPSIERLKQMGAWMKVNGEAIYGTQASPYPRQLPWGRITRRALPDGGETLYLHIWAWPEDGKLALPALQQAPVGARLIASLQAVLNTQLTPEGLEVTLPKDATPDPYITVAALTFAKPVQVAIDAYLSPGKDGVLTLTPNDADRHGSTAGVIQLRGKGAQMFITDWFEARWYLAYRIKTPAALTYAISAEVAAEKPTGLVVRTSKKNAVTTSIPSTGGADVWKTVELGSLKLPKGDIVLEIRAASSDAWKPLNLRNVTLRPVEANP